MVNNYYELLQDSKEDTNFLEKIINANENVILELNDFFELKRKKEELKPLQLEEVDINNDLLHNFETLKTALESKNFNKIKEAFSQIDEKNLTQENKVVFEHISSLIKNYKFNDALRILEK